MRHRYRISLIGLLLAGCGVQAAPADPRASQATAAPAANATSPRADRVTAAPTASPTATSSVAYPQRRPAELTPIVSYPTPPVGMSEPIPSSTPTPMPTPTPLTPTPSPTPPGPPPVTPAPADPLPADRIWLDAGPHIVAIGRDGSALSFGIPAALADPDYSQYFIHFIRRQGSTPLGIFTGGPQADWHIVDPATGVVVKLPLGGSTPPGGPQGADPSQLLLADGESGGFSAALVDLTQGSAELVDMPDSEISHGGVIAWREKIVYARGAGPGGGSPYGIWRVDLSEPPSAVKLFELSRGDGSLRVDQSRGLILARKAGADNATLIDVASGAEEELPIPVGKFSPDGALIAALRPTAGGAEAVVYDRASGTERALAGGAVALRTDLVWFPSGEALLLVPAGEASAIGRFPGGSAIVKQVWLDGRAGRSLPLERPLHVTILDDDHLLVLYADRLEAPALDGGPPAFPPVPVLAGQIIHVP